MITQKQLETIHGLLVEKGYTKYKQEWQNSDFVYWKSFDKRYDEDGDKIVGYQVGFAFWDYSKYPQFKPYKNKTIGVSYNFLLGSSDYKIDRLDLCITDSKMTIEQFEEFCAQLYSNKIIQNLKK